MILEQRNGTRCRCDPLSCLIKVAQETVLVAVHERAQASDGIGTSHLIRALREL